jgi:hypothetical protein
MCSLFKSFSTGVLLPSWVAERLAGAFDDALKIHNPKNVSTTFMTEEVMC